jgi:hypothetical protein
MSDLIRCDWTMPENEVIQPGQRCVKDADHGSVHVIAIPAGSSVTYWQVKPRKRTAQAILHVDLRDNTTLDDEECYALYHFMKVAKGASK